MFEKCINALICIGVEMQISADKINPVYGYSAPSIQEQVPFSVLQCLPLPTFPPGLHAPQAETRVGLAADNCAIAVRSQPLPFRQRFPSTSIFYLP